MRRSWWDGVKRDVERMHRSGINADRELRGNKLTQVHMDKPVCMCVYTVKS